MVLAAAVSLTVATLYAQATPEEQKIAANAAGVGDLLVAPTRVILNARKRTAELALINIGNTPATYRVSLVHMQMLESGELKEAKEPPPGEQFADSLLRFAPRQVTLEPHVAQTVRVQLRLPADLSAGEYRAHMLFQSVPPAETTTAPQPSEPPQSGFNIRLTPVYGVSIPVIVRSGSTSVAASITDLQLASNGELTFRLHRTGNQSVYGNVTIRFQPRGGKEQVVGIVNGMAVYTPLTSRMASVALQPPAGVTLSHGRLRVTYTDAEGNAGEVLAGAELEIP